ncbi:MAG: hypothetical protein ACTSUV_06775 [Candidatus Ranarchaeia archaeon]
MPSITYIQSPPELDILQRFNTLLSVSTKNDFIINCYTLEFAQNIFGKVKIIKESIEIYEGANHAWFYYHGFVFNWLEHEDKITITLPLENIHNEKEFAIITKILEKLGFWKKSNLPYYLVPIAFIIILQITINIIFQPIGLGSLLISVISLTMVLGTLGLIFSIRERGIPIPSFLQNIEEDSVNNN